MKNEQIERRSFLSRFPEKVQNQFMVRWNVALASAASGGLLVGAHKFELGAAAMILAKNALKSAFEVVEPYENNQRNTVQNAGVLYENKPQLPHTETNSHKK